MTHADARQPPSSVPRPGEVARAAVAELWVEGEPARVTGWALVRAANLATAHYMASLAAADLTQSQFSVLVHLLRDPHLTQGELARRVRVTPQSMGPLLRSLVGRGLVTRAEASGRGRPNDVTITDEGLAVLDEATPPLVALSSARSLGLTEREAVTLDQLLRKVRTALDRPPGTMPPVEE